MRSGERKAGPTVANDKQQTGRRTFCDHFIEISGEPWAGTYCKLEAGHDGDHSPHYPADPPMVRAVLAASRAFAGAVR